MSNVEVITTNPLNIKVSGRIKADNAIEYQNEIKELLKTYNHDSVIIDFSDLDYISSAGLRIFLSLIKEGESINIIEASPNVYEVFDMTGFNQIIPIKKRLREISIDGLEVIGSGQTGTVYRLDEETIVKVFNPNHPEELIQREEELAKKTLLLGLNTAIAFDLVRVGERIGMVFELINAESVTQLIEKDPKNRKKYIEIYANLMRQLHNIEGNPNEFKSSIEKRIGTYRQFGKLGYSDEEVETIVNEILKLPERNTLLHGDPNGGNILIRDGEGMFIDMSTLGIGHPMIDLANIMVGLRQLDEKFNFTENSCQDLFLKSYFQVDSEDDLNELKKQFKPWINLIEVYSIFFAPNYFPEEERKRAIEELKISAEEGFPSLTF